MAPKRQRRAAAAAAETADSKQLIPSGPSAQPRGKRRAAGAQSKPAGKPSKAGKLREKPSPAKRRSAPGKAGKLREPSPVERHRTGESEQQEALTASGRPKRR